jgi:hypothetical protein
MGASSTLKIIKKKKELKKLQPPKIEGVKNSKKQETIQCYKGQFPNTQNIIFLLLLKFKDDL